LNNDFLDPVNALEMPALADSAIAMDFLLSVKNGIRSCAVALTESATPEVRTVLHGQLNAGLDLHRDLTRYMMDKGWLHPYEPPEQFNIDMKSARTAVQIAEMRLFPAETNRLGTFATPEQARREEQRA
jgi:spore coat protein CotF